MGKRIKRPEINIELSTTWQNSHVYIDGIEIPVFSIEIINPITFGSKIRVKLEVTPETLSIITNDYSLEACKDTIEQSKEATVLQSKKKNYSFITCHKCKGNICRYYSINIPRKLIEHQCKKSSS